MSGEKKGSIEKEERAVPRMKRHQEIADDGIERFNQDHRALY